MAHIAAFPPHFAVFQLGALGLVSYQEGLKLRIIRVANSSSLKILAVLENLEVRRSAERVGMFMVRGILGNDHNRLEPQGAGCRRG
jgi:hypothetical protein